MKKIIGRKLTMTQLYRDDVAIGVTPVALKDAADIEGFKIGEMIHVSGITRGHGFQGVVKRHNFRGGPKTHGQKNRYRAPGSIGNTTPQRVLPGRKMAGHMGVIRVTLKNLKIIDINTETHIVHLRGAVPGVTGGRVELRK